MQFIHCTKKLLTELGALDSKLPSEHAYGFFGPWHANLIRIERRKCILFTNDRTLYSFLVSGVKKKDLDDFRALFVLHLRMNLSKEGFGPEDVNRAVREYGEIMVAPTINRSVLGSMNDIAGQADFLIHRAGGLDGTDMLMVNMMLNRIPMGSIKYRYAIEKVYEVFDRTDAVRFAHKSSHHDV